MTEEFGIEEDSIEEAKEVQLSEEFYVDSEGNFLGSFIGSVPEGGIQVPTAPRRATQKWLGDRWSDEASKAELYAHSADRRWQLETGGFEINGMQIATDDRSKTLITGARIKADSNPQFTTPWKQADGSYVRLTVEQILALSDAMLIHVAYSFDKEETIAGQIESGEITTFEQLETAWNS